MRMSKPNRSLLTPPPNNDYGILGISIVHDLAGPLSATRIHIDQLSAAVDRMERLIQSAQYDIRKTNKITTIQILPTIQKVAQDVQKLHPGLTISVRGADKLTIKGDASKFRTIVSNMARNAAESYNSEAKGKVIIYYRITANGVIISVRDFGIGYRSIRQHSGMGLGIIRDLVRTGFDGEFTIRRAITKGTVAEVRLYNM